MENTTMPADAGRPSRPSSVRNAVLLIFATLALGLVRAALEFSTVAKALEPAGGAPLVVGAQVLVFGFFTLLAVLLYKRHGWVRYVYGALFLFGVGTSAYTLPKAFSAVPVSAALGLAQLVVQVIVLVLLFKRASSEWYSGKAGA